MQVLGYFSGINRVTCRREESMRGVISLLAASAVLALLIGGCKSEDQSREKPDDKVTLPDPGAPGQKASDRVVVVLSKDFPLYKMAVDGFRDDFDGQVKQVFVPRKSDGSGAEGADLGAFVEQVRAEKPDAILAVGLMAAKMLTSKISDIPVVFCMAMHPSQHNLKAGNSTGIELETLPRNQIEVFKEVVPDLKRIGIIYDHKRTGRFVDAAKQAAAEAGLTLVAKQVSEQKEVLGALQDLTKEVDALWLLRDATVLTREFFNHALTVQKKSRFPLLAYSPEFVKRGALCSYSSTYQQQGKTAAEVMREILSGKAKAGDIPIQSPKGSLTVNLASAAHLGLKLPRSILADPDVEKIEKTDSDQAPAGPPFPEPSEADMFKPGD
jgi:putative ABC transport system substrate-binding protein